MLSARARATAVATGFLLALGAVVVLPGLDDAPFHAFGVHNTMLAPSGTQAPTATSSPTVTAGDFPANASVSTITAHVFGLLDQVERILLEQKKSAERSYNEWLESIEVNQTSYANLVFEKQVQKAQETLLKTLTTDGEKLQKKLEDGLKKIKGIEKENHDKVVKDETDMQKAVTDSNKKIDTQIKTTDSTIKTEMGKVKEDAPQGAMWYPGSA